MVLRRQYTRILAKDPRSPLLGRVRAELAESYRLLTPVLTS
jgi:hypothetical protein